MRAPSSRTFSPDKKLFLSQVVFTLTVTNGSSSVARNVVVTDFLPSGYAYVSHQTSDGAYDTGTGDWALITLNKNSSAVLSLVVTVNASGDYTNIAEITASDLADPDSVPGNGDPTEDDYAEQSTSPQPNDAPVITGQVALATPEDTALTLTLADLTVTDPDNAYPADFTLTVQAGADYTVSGAEITPAASFAGALTVPVTVNDGTDTSAPFDLLVTVNPVNDAPVITGQVALATPEDTALTLTLADLTVTDPDNAYPADFTLTVQAGADYTVSGAEITPAASFAGALTVPVTVNDGTDTSAPFDLLVTVNPVNDAPVITGQVALATPEDTALTLTLADLTVTDPDNAYPADFTLTVQAGADYTVSGAEITPAASFAGALTVPVTVNDGTDSSAPFDLLVTVNPAHPNVVVIMVDDLDVVSADVLSQRGWTPNIDALLAGSVAFANGFVTNPMCCPSRSSFLTGQYPHNHGVLYNYGDDGGADKLDEASTIAVALQPTYRTIYLGKYLNAYGVETTTEHVPQGWDEWHALVDHSTYKVYDYRINHNGTVQTYGSTEADYQTDVLRDLAVSLIPGAEPFFYVYFNACPACGKVLARRLHHTRDAGTDDPSGAASCEYGSGRAATGARELQRG